MQERKATQKNAVCSSTSRRIVVNHLRRAGEATKKKQYTKGTKNKLKNARFTQNQVAAGISSIITEPNAEWYKLKRSQYVMEKTFFGLCTSC